MTEIISFLKLKKDNKFLKINKFIKFKHTIKYNKANINNTWKAVKIVIEGIKEVRTAQKWFILLHDGYFEDKDIPRSRYPLVFYSESL